MTPSEPIPIRRQFPWLQLTRAFGIAVSFRLILLSGLALFAVTLGRQAADSVAPHDSVIRRPAAETTASSEHNPAQTNRSEAGHSASNASLAQMNSWNWPSDWTAPLCWLAPPWFSIVTSARQTVSGSEGARGRAAFDCLWGLVVWSAFGLAICRLAAIRFARDEDGSLRQATQFGITRWRRAFSAPVIPLAAALVVMLPVLVMVWLGQLPLIGTTWLIMVSPVLLTFGFLIGVFLLTAAVGWPLMIAAIAVDDCDGFGGVSRSYSLWTGGLFFAVWCSIVAVTLGIVIHTLVSLALNEAQAITLNIATLVTGRGPTLTQLADCCTPLVRGLRDCFGISYFWTSITIIYLLLRRSIDKLPLDQIAPSDGERPPHDPLPVVGMPAVADKPPSV